MPEPHRRLLRRSVHRAVVRVWIDAFYHEGRLLWDGSKYDAYFGCTENWGAIGVHEQDYQWSFDGAGSVVSAPQSMYDWICGHSVDLRLAYNGTALTTACLSDCNYDINSVANPGIYVGGKRVLTVAGNCAGQVDALLGGLVADPTGFWISFAAPNGGAYDVGMMFVPSGGGAGPVAWLTNTPGVQETAPHLARYGANLLAAWQVGGATKMAVVSTAGAVLDGPIDVTPQFSMAAISSASRTGTSDGRARGARPASSRSCEFVTVCSRRPCGREPPSRRGRRARPRAARRRRPAWSGLDADC